MFSNKFSYVVMLVERYLSNVYFSVINGMLFISNRVKVCLFIWFIFWVIKLMELNRLRKYIMKVVVVSGKILNKVKLDIIISLKLNLFNV